MVESRKKSPTKQTIKVFPGSKHLFYQPTKQEKKTQARLRKLLAGQSRHLPGVISQARENHHLSPGPSNQMGWWVGHLSKWSHIVHRVKRIWDLILLMTPCISVYIWFSSCYCHLSKSAAEKDVQWIFETTSKALGTIPWSQKQKRGPASTSRFLVHSSVFCTYNKTRVVGCKLKRQIGCSKRQETMYRKQLN